MLPTLVLTLIVATLFFAGLGIRILLLKNGQFKGTCASQSPYLKNQIGTCELCGKPADQQGCGMDDEKQQFATS